MPVSEINAVIGGQWGDEGKGKIVDLLAEKAEVVARGTGGPNAGHTVEDPSDKEKTLSLHCIPSGITNPRAINIMGKGMVISLPDLYNEIGDVKSRGIDISGRLFVSDNAHIILQHYKTIDKILEKNMMEVSGQGIGTTSMGIGPAYVFKASRYGITFGDMLHDERLKDNLLKNVKFAKFFGLDIKADRLRDELLSDYEKIHAFVEIKDTDALLKDCVMNDGKNVLLEGAQGTLLSIEHGTYPYVTSSDSTANGLCSGVGMPADNLDRVYLVFKVYPTRVGNGPMPTRMDSKTDEMIRQKAHEFGATTGRPRHCGWFDAVAARYAVEKNGATDIALTRLDIFDDVPELYICTRYKLPDGSELTEFPAYSGILEKCRPVYELMKGWKNTKGIKDYEKLPPGAKEYIARLEGIIGIPVSIISNGRNRHDAIFKN